MADLVKKMKRNSIGQNILHLFYSTALSSAINAGALIMLAYYLQSHNYGIFSVALAFATIMGYFTDVGLSNVVLREGSKKEEDVSVIMSSYIKMRLALLAATIILGFLFIWLTHANKQELISTSLCLIIPMVTGIAMQSIGTTFFQLMEKMQYYGLIRLISAAFLIISISSGIFLSLNPYFISFLYGFSYFLAGFIAIILVRRCIKISMKNKFHKGLLRGLGSFTIGGLLFVTLPHLGTIVLEKTLSLQEVGLFAVAYRIPQALQQILFIVAGAYYPVLFRYFNNNQLQEHLKLNIIQIKITALLGMAMVIPFYHLSDSMIYYLFGEHWASAATPLKILSILLILQSISISLADGLTTRGLQFYRTLIQFLAFIIGIFLYFYLSRKYGVVGAAYAGITIEAIALLGFWIAMPNRWKIAFKAIFPYLFYFIIGLLSIDYFLHSFSLLATGCNLILIALLLIVDKELYSKMRSYVKERMKGDKWRRKQSQGVDHGL